MSGATSLTVRIHLALCNLAAPGSIAAVAWLFRPGRLFRHMPPIVCSPTSPHVLLRRSAAPPPFRSVLSLSLLIQSGTLSPLLDFLCVLFILSLWCFFIALFFLFFIFAYSLFT